MPKETCHFLIASEIVSRLDPSPLRRACESDLGLVYLGAIFHDALYYYEGDETEVQELADALHGAQGENTFEVLQVLDTLGHGPSDLAMPSQTFRLGVASHVFTDVHFHPMVYFFTGNYYASDPAQQLLAQKCHRKLEAQLDWLLAKDAIFERTHKLVHILGQYREKLKAILEALCKSGPLFQEVSAEQLLSAYDSYAMAQRVYQSRLLMTGLKGARFLLPKNLQHTVDQLNTLSFTRKLEPDYAFLDHGFEFRHPVTNALIRTSVSELREQAVCSTLDYLATAPQRSASDWGPSLETGMAKVGVTSMAYFSAPPRAKPREFSKDCARLQV